MSTTLKKEAVKDASHLYEVERRAYHLQRPGFRISELQLSPTQTVPWHCHNNVSDTFYVLEGRLRLFLQNPKQEVSCRTRSRRCNSASAKATRWQRVVRTWLRTPATHP